MKRRRSEGNAKSNKDSRTKNQTPDENARGHCQQNGDTIEREIMQIKTL